MDHCPDSSMLEGRCCCGRKGLLARGHASTHKGLSFNNKKKIKLTGLAMSTVWGILIFAFVFLSPLCGAREREREPFTPTGAVLGSPRVFSSLTVLTMLIREKLNRDQWSILKRKRIVTGATRERDAEQ